MLHFGSKYTISRLCMDKGIIEELRSSIGKVEEVWTDAAGDCYGKFGRVRVSIDITKPLKKILLLEQEEEEEVVMPVLYERLPDFCFCRGCLGHQFRECSKYSGMPQQELPYGNWLKAMSPLENTQFFKNKGRGQKESPAPGKRTQEKQGNDRREQEYQEDVGKEGGDRGSNQDKVEMYVEPIKEGQVEEKSRKQLMVCSMGREEVMDDRDKPSSKASYEPEATRWRQEGDLVLGRMKIQARSSEKGNRGKS